MEPRVKAAFDWLDDTHNAANECWADYQKKLQRWHDHKAEFKAFLDNFDEFKKAVAPWVKKPEYIADCPPDIQSSTSPWTKRPFAGRSPTAT